MSRGMSPPSFPLYLFSVQCDLDFTVNLLLSLASYRLQLAHNQLSHIAYEFTGCSALRYLNLRDNRFRQVPKAVG